MWFENAFERCGGTDPSMSRQLGNLLGDDPGQMYVQFAAGTDMPDAAYRDDNSLLWDISPTPIGKRARVDPSKAQRTPRELDDDRVSATTADPEQISPQISSTSAVPARDPNAGDEPLASPRRYPEWD